MPTNQPILSGGYAQIKPSIYENTAGRGFGTACMGYTKNHSRKVNIL
jgi:hypothetical protein